MASASKESFSRPPESSSPRPSRKHDPSPRRFASSERLPLCIQVSMSRRSLGDMLASEMLTISWHSASSSGVGRGLTVTTSFGSGTVRALSRRLRCSRTPASRVTFSVSACRNTLNCAADLNSNVPSATFLRNRNVTSWKTSLSPITVGTSWTRSHCRAHDLMHLSNRWQNSRMAASSPFLIRAKNSSAETELDMPPPSRDA